MMTQEDAIRKAMACLRLAKSDNPNESALAAARAQEIIDRYKLDLSGMDPNGDSAAQKAFEDEPINDYGYDDPFEKQRDLHPWMLRLASYIARSNGCRILWHRDGRFGGVIKIIGRGSDVAAARYMHAFLRNEVVRLIKANTNAGHSGSYKRQFGLGVTDTIWQKLAAAKQAMHSDLRNKAENPMALMRVNNAIANLERREQAMEKYMEGFCIHGKSYIGRTTDGGARAAGQLAGKSIVLNGAKSGLTSGVKAIGA